MQYHFSGNNAGEQPDLKKIGKIVAIVAVLVVLVAGVFGSGDKQRVNVTTQVGHTTHVGLTDDGEQVQLPFALTLKEFTMDEYPPKLYVLDTRTESSSMDFLSVEAEGAAADIEGWHIVAERSIDMAGRLTESGEWQQMEHIGAAPAVYVRARHTLSGEEFESICRQSETE